MPCFLRKLLSCFIFSRQRRHAFAGGWTGNKIIIVRRDGTEKVLSPFARIRGLHLKIDGSNNVLRLHEPFHFRGLRICLERGSRVDIGPSPYHISGWFWIQYGGSLQIGKNFSNGARLEIIGFDEDNLSVHIGDDCLFSHDILIRPSDGHTLFGLASDKVLNGGKDIVIGNHVWAGMRCVFLKGAKIPDHSVVGANSLVNKAFTQTHSVYAGSPSRRINKISVDWDRRSPREFRR